MLLWITVLAALVGVGVCAVVLVQHARALRRLQRDLATLQRARTIYRVNGRPIPEEELRR